MQVMNFSQKDSKLLVTNGTPRWRFAMKQTGCCSQPSSRSCMLVWAQPKWNYSPQSLTAQGEENVQLTFIWICQPNMIHNETPSMLQLGVRPAKKNFNKRDAIFLVLNWSTRYTPLSQEVWHGFDTTILKTNKWLIEENNVRRCQVVVNVKAMKLPYCRNQICFKDVAEALNGLLKIARHPR